MSRLGSGTTRAPTEYGTKKCSVGTSSMISRLAAPSVKSERHSASNVDARLTHNVVTRRSSEATNLVRPFVAD